MKPEITVIDRRGAAHVHSEPETPKPEPEKEEVRVGKRTWKSQGFMIVMAQGPQGVIISGRVVGLRGDGQLCVADYMFSPIVPEHEDWKKEARRRLNTFLGCDCKTGHQCHTHQIAIPNWTREDVERVKKSTQKNLPEAIEVMMKAEQARQKTQLVVPR